MKLINLIISIGLCFFVIHCNPSPTNNNNKDDFDNGPGLNIYLSNYETYPISDCKNYYSINRDTIKLKCDPIISYNEITTYDTTSHIITLSIARDSILTRIDSIFNGLSCMITLNSSNIYHGWIVSPILSMPPPGPYIDIYMGIDSLSSNQIVIELGEGVKLGCLNDIDPRSNKLIFDRLIQDNKAK